MVLPLTLLRAAQNRPMMVELKSGETYSGLLANCDGFMNLHLKDSVCTSKDGERFWKLTECYIRGNMVKYIRLQEEVLETAKDDKKDGRGGADRGRGGR
ncbi:hypothetical protein NCLIV_067060 [Neospora caninum Liverpool]|uniref:U6 snRNA-associated Sm-like protein LSm4 n=1 Tax=Neospora caninum (strain Liverpool) TaxID=572307 RepID=F0VRD3_NEOCL|nr:hypothetical protein NCLIV_067060 [Neospora caninum Liverpool]CBZ56281.1 hypothetical protein NCLIV_067060 [Neospora caninum Liverpool]|eukprot:XP_003886306.1 hypothetical protein NCLIV_067060 [Neospora caninum Liverpool]